MPSSLPRRHALKLFGGATALGMTTVLGSRAADRARHPVAGAAPAASGTGPAAPPPIGLRSTMQGLVTGPTRVGAWAAAPVAGDSGRPALGFTECTVRMVVRTSVGGTAPRIRLSNLSGTGPLLVESATIGVRAKDSSAVSGSLSRVFFGGSHRAVVPRGGELLSDPIAIRRPIAARDALLVSLYLPGPTGPATWHPRSQDATHIAPGDRTEDGSGRRFTDAQTGWFYLSGLDLVSPVATGTVVCFGDSITDGAAPSLTQVGGRWSDALATRIAKARPDRPLGVVDLGIAANMLLTDNSGTTAGRSGLNRFRQDALEQTGLTDVIVLEGINDIRQGKDGAGGPLTAAALIAGYRTLIRQARAVGAAVHGGTVTPFQGDSRYSAAGEHVRQQVNKWIRTGGEFDSVADFDRAIRDPAHPARYRPSYDRGDHLHPGAAGYTALAAAVDLAALRG